VDDWMREILGALFWVVILGLALVAATVIATTEAGMTGGGW
jgi:cobalamin biosynthesis protein CobD/CbiB